MLKLNFIITLVLLLINQVSSQTTTNYAAPLHATIQESPAKITLHIVEDTDATAYTLYRKLATSSTWGTAIASLAANDSIYVDSTISVGVSYEYRLMKQGVAGSSFVGYGYINAGVKVPVIESRGRIILIVDSSQVTALASELQQLENDMRGDGWIVDRFDINPNSSVPVIKGLIYNTYNLNPSTTKALLLFGDIPVPYSGNIYPDGHPNHEGAWPADVFYADMNGAWSDVSVNNTVASDSRNDNIPGDGKFDQSLFTNVELQVGRVDLSNLPTFAESEEELLRRYLNKNHAFRNKKFDTKRQGVIDDNFTNYSEAFAANGYRNFTAFFGADDVVDANYFTSMQNDNYLWSYGCGAGTQTSCSGVGSTANFANDSLGSIFTMLFGSYFGDWDRNDNLLRAALASGSTLTNCWAGRPNWYFHHMAMGQHIGYSTMLSQNNSSLYFAGLTAEWIHIALMGDPTLRMHIVAPPQNLSLVPSSNHLQVTWSAAADSILGYYIYRKGSGEEGFTRITNNWLSDTSFVDSCVVSDSYEYMVRALKLEESASGSYYNLSQGLIDSISINNNFTVNSNFTLSLVDSTITINNTSTAATQYLWTFGDSSSSTQLNPQHSYSANGTYTILLTAYNECSTDTTSQTITISVFTPIVQIEENLLMVYPNPAHEIVQVEFRGNIPNEGQIELVDALGRVLLRQNINNRKTSINLKNLPAAVYTLRVQAKKETIYVQKIMLH